MPVNYSWDGNHVVYLFNQDIITGSDCHLNICFPFLHKCNEMSSWLQCQNDSMVFSGHRIAIGWDDWSQALATVIAWVNMDRGNVNLDRNMYLSIGVVGQTYSDHCRIPTPIYTGHKSSVGPGVACKAYGVGSYYDCIIAYVDHSDKLYEVRTSFFYAYKSGNSYSVVFEPGYRQIGSNIRTTSDIALWYDRRSSFFYIAIRPARSGQSLEVYRSVDGTAWNFSCCLPYNDVAPSVISYLEAYNQYLVYAKKK